MCGCSGREPSVLPLFRQSPCSIHLKRRPLNTTLKMEEEMDAIMQPCNTRQPTCAPRPMMIHCEHLFWVYNDFVSA